MELDCRYGCLCILCWRWLYQYSSIPY
jgi:hypothetical protein